MVQDFDAAEKKRLAAEKKAAKAAESKRIAAEKKAAKQVGGLASLTGKHCQKQRRQAPQAGAFSCLQGCTMCVDELRSMR